jgi:hypothetical protein
MKSVSRQKWDLFILHASEDKRAFVAPLATALTAFGVNVWYDEYELRLGDSLSRSIDAGLARSDYGLVVLSKAFFTKNWPERELSGLVSREIAGRKVILPIWHQVGFQDVVSYSPPLADKFAIKSDSMSVTEVAVKIIETIRPNLFTHIQRRAAYIEAMRTAKTSRLALETIIKGPIRHPTFPDDLVGRIRLVRASLLGVHTCSMEVWLDGFQRDAHPSREVAHWEHVAAVYHEYVFMTPEVRTLEDHKAVFNYISVLWMRDKNALAHFSSKLPSTAPKVIRELYRALTPVYDIRESQVEPTAEQELDQISESGYADKERFPQDIPDNLVRKLIDPEKSSGTD